MAYKTIPPGRTNWYIAYQPYPGAKERRKSTKTSNEKAAEKILSKVKVELAEGRFLNKRTEATMTLKQFGETLYLPRMAVAKPRSNAWRRDRWKQVTAVLGAGMTLEVANRIETVETYVTRRLGKVSLATVKEDVAVFRHGIRMAARWKGETDLEEYRLHEWRAPEDPNPPAPPEPVQPADWDKLLAVARRRARKGAWGSRQGFAVMLLCRTLGARRGEVLRLRRKDVDLKSGEVRRLILKKKTVGEIRETIIEGEPLELLRSIARSHRHELIFANPKTGRQRHDIDGFWKSIRRDAGVRPKFHGIRHAFGRDFLAAGGTTRELQDRLGHSSIRTTEKYSHLAKRTTPPRGLPVEMSGVISGAYSQRPRKAPVQTKKPRKKSARSRGNGRISRRLA